MDARWLLAAFVLLVLLVGLLVGIHVWRRTSQLRQVSFDVQERRHFLSDAECDELISLAQQKTLQPSKVYASGQEKLDLSSRTSSQAWLDSTDGPAVGSLKEKVARWTGLPESHQESVQIARYGPGGKFEPHYDACEKDCESMNARGGQRFSTVLVYLNDGFSGGTTSFPLLGRKVVPEKGKAILFYNVDRRTQQIIRTSLHGGDALLSGEKWVANCWTRMSAFRAD